MITGCWLHAVHGAIERLIPVSVLGLTVFFLPLSADAVVQAGIDHQQNIESGNLQLADDCYDGLLSLALEYQTYSLVAEHKTIRTVRPEDQVQESPILRISVMRGDGCHYRVDGNYVGRDGDPTAGGTFLISENGAWDLKRDAKTNAYFVTRHGRGSMTAESSRSEEWWADAAFSFRNWKLSKRLFGNLENGLKSEIAAITEHRDSETGEALVTIRSVLFSDEPTASGLKETPVSTDECVFYKDHQWAVKEVTQLTYSGEANEPVKLVQTCEYQTLDDGVPRLRKVELTQYKSSRRSESEDAKWEQVYRETVNISTINLNTPDESEFRIQKFIPDYRRVTPSPSTKVKWFFLLNAILFLGVWFLIRRRNKNRTPLA